MTTNELKNQRNWNLVQLSLFLVGVVILCIPVFSMDYLITLDGPNHLYSSNVFYKTLGGNGFYNTFFETNSNFTPNYFTTLILGGLQTIFTSVTALKIFHILHILLFVSGAYFWSNSKKDSQKVFPFLIFPFVYSYLFFSGFYNFVFAVSISLFLLGIYERYMAKEWKTINYIIIGGLLFITYVSHIIPFFFSGLVLFISTIIEWKKSNWSKKLLKHGIYLFIAALPGLLVTLFFMGSRHSDYTYLDFKELISRITSGFSIVIKNDSADDLPMINSFKLAFLSAALMLFIYKLVSQKKDKNWALPISVLSILALYFILPDSVGYASVFSVRIEYIFWLFIVIGSTKLAFKNRYIDSFSALIGIALLIFQINSNLPYWRILNSHAKSIVAASQALEDNTVVYPVFNSLIWDDYHISNILGTTGKDLVILENSSARQDYFPLIYKAPYEDCLKEQQSDNYNCEGQDIEIDYLLVVGKIILEDPLAIKLYGKAYNEGEVIYEDDFVQLLKFPTLQN